MMVATATSATSTALRRWVTLYMNVNIMKSNVFILQRKTKDSFLCAAASRALRMAAKQQDAVSHIGLSNMLYKEEQA